MTALDQRPAPSAPTAPGEPAAPGPTGSGLRARLARAREVFAKHLWPSIVVFTGLAAAATLSSGRGDYIGDNRFEQYWNPARRIAMTLTIWDGSRGLGRVREDFWPATTLPVAALRGLGFSPPVAQQLFHALLIAMAGVGTVAIVRLFRGRIGLEHLLAGLFVSFGAYSATFLVPSNLYFSFALAPWLVVVTYRGLHSSRPWRWAAMFALLLFLPGNADTPGVIYNLVPLVAVLIYVLAVERSVRLRDAVAWLARAGVLTIGTNLAMLVKTYLAAGALGQRLSDTEAADVSAFTSSWTESLRGLGNWLSYFRDAGGMVKPQGELYFINGFVIACTFIPPIVAVFVLWQSRWRVRIFYAIAILLSAVVLVGGYPRASPSPFGARLLDAFTSIKGLGAFRNTYKIGSGVAIGVAALFAYGVMLGYRTLRRRSPQWRALPIIVAFLTLAGVSFPFWTGQLYDPQRRMEALPAYWGDAFDYLADIPTEGRSLVLPQTSRAQYRWGWVGDDIFDALDARNHAIATGIPLSTPVPANILEALTVVGSDPFYVPGTLAPMMRRLGLTEIVLRNDLDWQELARPRPSTFDGVRRDPDFELRRSFGRPGENTVGPEDTSDTAQKERSLPPVEVWALRDTTGAVAAATGPPTVVAGDGFAWAALAQAGLLADGAPVAFTGDTPDETLRADLTAGAPVLVTDSNRRRLRVVLAYEADYSHTLAEGQQLDRPTQSLFTPEGSQSVAWFPDATQVDLTGSPRSVGGSQTWNRPPLAFDGDPTTAWTIRTLDEPVGRALGLSLRRPTELREARIVQLADVPPGITSAHLRFGDGSRVPVELTARETTVAFPPRTTDRVELIVDAVAAVATVGVAELAFPGVDATEYVQAPDDVFRRAEADPRLADLVRRAPTGYVFARSVRATTRTNPLPALTGAATTDEETSLRRRFRTMGTHQFDVGGRMRLRADTPDEVVDGLVGGDHGAAASVRLNGSLGAHGGHVVDGDPATSWLAPAESGVSVTLRFPRQEIRTLDLASAYDGSSSKIDRVQVESSDGSVVGTGTLTPSDPACDSAARAPAGCRRVGKVTLDKPLATEKLTVRVVGVSGREANLGGRIKVDEILLNGRANTPLHAPGARPRPCLPGLRFDAVGGAAGSGVPLTIDATLDDILDGDSVPVKGCQPLTLAEGWHTMDTGAHSTLDTLHLLEPAAVAGASGGARAPAVALKDRAPTELRFTVRDSGPGTIVVFNQSYDKGWRAMVDGVTLGPPRNLNGMNAWSLDGTGTREVELRYNPRGLYGYSLPLTGLAMLLCAFLALRRPRAERRRALARYEPAGATRD